MLMTRILQASPRRVHAADLTWLGTHGIEVDDTMTVAATLVAAVRETRT
jgi:hypothetical protein